MSEKPIRQWFAYLLFPAIAAITLALHDQPVDRPSVARRTGRVEMENPFSYG